jgi:hypothetical protein
VGPGLRAGELSGLLHRHEAAEEAQVTGALLGLAVFVSSFLYDGANVRFLQAVHERNPGRATCWSVATTLVGLIGLTGILKYSYWLIVPEILGIAAGTYHGVWSSPPMEREILVVVSDTEQPRVQSDEARASVN